MDSSRINLFRQHGLNVPIVIKPGIKNWLFLIASSLLLLGGCSLGVFKKDMIDFSIYLLCLTGLLFFGSALLWYTFLLIRGTRPNGLLSLTNNGLYYGMYDIQFAWTDIGPAWSYTIADHTDVLFILRNASFYQKQLKGFAKIHYQMMERQFKSQTGGLLDKGMMAIGTHYDALGEVDQTINVLNDARLRIQMEPDSAIIGLPSITRFGLSNEETLEIINTIVFQREMEEPKE